MGLKDVWEEGKSQVQGQHSVFFDLYEDTLLSVCRAVLEPLPQETQRLLWLSSELVFKSDDGIPPPAEELLQALKDELFNEVWAVAADEEIVSEDREPAEEPI